MLSVSFLASVDFTLDMRYRPFVGNLIILTSGYSGRDFGRSGSEAGSSVRAVVAPEGVVSIEPVSLVDTSKEPVSPLSPVFGAAEGAAERAADEEPVLQFDDAEGSEKDTAAQSIDSRIDNASLCTAPCAKKMNNDIQTHLHLVV